MANWLSEFTTDEISPSTLEEHRRHLKFEIMVAATGVRCKACQLAVETLLALTSFVFLVFFVLLVLLLLSSSTKNTAAYFRMAIKGQGLLVLLQFLFLGYTKKPTASIVQGTQHQT